MAIGHSINLNSPELHEMEAKGRFHLRAFLLSQEMTDVMMRSADFIQELRDDLGIRFCLACEFMTYDLEDAFSASTDALSRCGFFPYAELAYEFDAFQTLLLQGSFKSTRDSMRRMLDVCLTAVVYLLGLKDEEEARKWVASEVKTTMVTGNIRYLEKHPDVAALDGRFKFTENLHALYGCLSNYCHSRGVEFSTGIRKGSQMDFNGIIMRGFNANECRKVMEEFVAVVGQLAILLVIQNIGLLAPVDKDAKWGLSGPISGFFYEHQTQRLFEVMPKQYAEYFKELAASDPRVKSLREHLDSLPNVTETEMQQQADEINEVIRNG